VRLVAKLMNQSEFTQMAYSGRRMEVVELGWEVRMDEICWDRQGLEAYVLEIECGCIL
jgi:hypothetical protein